MTLEFYSDRNILRIIFYIHVYEVNRVTEHERMETIQYNYKNLNVENIFVKITKPWEINALTLISPFADL